MWEHCLGIGLLIHIAHAQPLLTSDVVGRLVVMQDRVAEGLMARQLLEFGPAVVVGGEEAGSGLPFVLLLDAPGSWLKALPDPAAPYVAVSPDGRRLAYWRRVQVQETADMAQIVAVDPASGRFQTLSPPQLFLPGGVLHWPMASNVVFTASRPLPSGRAGVVWRLDVATGQTFCLVERPAGTLPGRLLASDQADEVIYTDSHGTLAVPITGAEPRQVDIERLLWRRPGADQWLCLAPRVELRGPNGTVAALPLRATHAAWAAGGMAVMLSARGRLFVAPGDLSFVRQLCGFEGQPREFTRVLWRRNIAEIACATLAPSPAVHLASLGVELVAASIFFPVTAQPQPGSKIWIALGFERDEFGQVVKPRWPTLKACFTVTASQQSEGGVLVEAENAGLQGGVVERIAMPPASPTGLSEIATSVSGRRVVWVQRYDVAPRHDLRAWIDGVPALGQLRSIHVERRRIDAP